MARIEVPVTQITDAGVEPAAQVVGNPSENHFLASNDGRVFIEAVNADAAATHTVTLLTPREVEGIPVEDPAIVVGKSKTVLIGPFSPQLFNQPNGQVYVNVAHAELKLRAFRF